MGKMGGDEPPACSTASSQPSRHPTRRRAGQGRGGQWLLLRTLKAHLWRRCGGLRSCFRARLPQVCQACDLSQKTPSQHQVPASLEVPRGYRLDDWEVSPIVSGESRQVHHHAPLAILIFRSFARLAQLLIVSFASARNRSGPRKGRLEMSGQSKTSRTLVAIAAALLTSSIAVGAAVGPAQAVASPVTVSANA